LTGPVAAVPALGPRHHEVKHLRTLLRDGAARRAAGELVLEGPRLVADALRRGVRLDALYLGPNAQQSFGPLVAQAAAAGVRVAQLKEGVLEKVGTTRTPQPVLAVAPVPDPPTLAELAARPGPVVVTVDVADPGNLGTVLRSAEAAGAAGVICCGGVDGLNPKVVRASAGAVFAVPVLGADDPAAVLVPLRAAGRRTYATVATGGVPYTAAPLADPVAVVMGSEANGLPAAVTDLLDGSITIPMVGATESLNVAVAASLLLFEAARQRL
jgi:TrmH family RNA methyltransferase